MGWERGNQRAIYRYLLLLDWLGNSLKSFYVNKPHVSMYMEEHESIFFCGKFTSAASQGTHYQGARSQTQAL